MNSVMCLPWSVYVFARKATEEARRNPGTRRFEGPGLKKPWYFQHRRQTPWPSVRLDGKPRPLARRVVRRMKRRLRRLGGKLLKRRDERRSRRTR
jgi:hypothetical protein